jgi:hypothetical protein
MNLSTLIHEFFNGTILRESSRKFDAADIIPAPERTRILAKFDAKAADVAGQKAILSAAQKGDNDAIIYLWLKCAPRVNQTFWKKFLGPNPSIRRARISSGAWEDWVSIAYQTLTNGFKEYRDAKGALETFDLDRVSYGNIIEIFGYTFSQLLGNSALEANSKEMSSGMTGVAAGGGKFAGKIAVDSYDGSFQDSEQEEHGDYADETFDTAYASTELDAFWPKWKRFVQDPALTVGKYGITPGALFKAVLDNPTWDIPDLTKRFTTLSRNTIQSYLDKCVPVLKQYGIDQASLQNAIQLAGAKKLTDYLVIADEPPEPAPIADNTTDDPFLSKFAAFAADPRLWNSARNGWAAAPVLYEWILNPKVDLDKLAKEAGVAKSYMHFYKDRAFKLLKQKGIEESDLKAAIKKHGAKELASYVGELDESAARGEPRLRESQL